jgi:hypothetical protein
MCWLGSFLCVEGDRYGFTLDIPDALGIGRKFVDGSTRMGRPLHRAALACVLHPRMWQLSLGVSSKFIAQGVLEASDA